MNTKTGAEIIIHDPVSAVNLNDVLSGNFPEWKGTKETIEDVTPGKKEHSREVSRGHTKLDSREVSKGAPKGNSKEVSRGIPKEISKFRPKPPPTPPSLNLPAKPPLPARQRSPRFAVKFRVILTFGKASFRTYTQDISISGMKLKDKVPRTFLGQRCTLFIGRTQSSENIEISCTVLADDPINPVRIQFTDMIPSTERALESWIEAEFIPHSRGGPK